MKNSIFILSSFVLYLSCSPCRNTYNKKNSDPIVYIIPDTVQRLLAKYISGESRKDLYFYISQEDDNCFCIFPLHVAKKSSDFIWVKETNRALFFNRRFYPLIFDLDKDFARIESANEIKRGFLSKRFFDSSLSRVTYNGFCVKFNRSGEVFK